MRAKRFFRILSLYGYKYESPNVCRGRIVHIIAGNIQASPDTGDLYSTSQIYRIKLMGKARGIGASGAVKEWGRDSPRNQARSSTTTGISRKALAFS
jgi:hypothetical protein